MPLARQRDRRCLLYVGDISPNTTSLARAQALEALGLDVLLFDASNVCHHTMRLLHLLGHRVYFTPEVFGRNRLLYKCVLEERPALVWIDKGRWIFPRTLLRIRKLGSKLVHYNTDDIYGKEQYLWLHRIGLRHYDFILTTNRHNVKEITSRYGLKVCRAGMGYDDQHYLRPSAATIADDSVDVVFVGHREQHTEDFLLGLMSAGLKVVVYGHEWKWSRNPALRKTQPIPQSEYCRTIASAKLALCVLSRRNRNESTGRSFEIPAIGGCLLAEDTPEHRYLFNAGPGAFFFSGTEDLIAKSRVLVLDGRLRRQVAEAGHRRCMELGLSWRDHIRREWLISERLLYSGVFALDKQQDLPFWAGFRRGEAYQQSLL